MSPYLPPAPSHRLLSSSVHVTVPSSRSFPPASLLCLSLSDLFKSNHLGFCQGLVQAPGNLCDIVFIDTNGRDNVDHIAMFTLLASWLLHRLREKRVLLAKEGEHGNVIYIVPPICINEDDVTQVARCLDEALAEAEMIGLEKIREGEAEERSRWEGAGGRYGDMD